MGKKSKTIKNISAKDLAKLKNVSFKSIYNAVASGRLIPLDPNARPLMFERDKAVADWENFRKDKHVPKGKRFESDNQDFEGPQNTEELFDEDGEVTKGNARTHLNIASAKLEKFKAANEELKYREQLGKLVDVENVQKEAFQIARITRDAILAIPDRISPQLCGITDPVVMHATLTKEINGALDQLVKQYSVNISSSDNEPGASGASGDSGTPLPESVSERADTGSSPNGE